ncbi:hypothetical protein LINPERHAP1_LOCUS21677 [Linum perenne]
MISSLHLWRDGNQKHIPSICLKGSAR